MAHSVIHVVPHFARLIRDASRRSAYQGTSRKSSSVVIPSRSRLEDATVVCKPGRVDNSPGGPQPGRCLDSSPGHAIAQSDADPMEPGGLAAGHDTHSEGLVIVGAVPRPDLDSVDPVRSVVDQAARRHHAVDQQVLRLHVEPRMHRLLGGMPESAGPLDLRPNGVLEHGPRQVDIGDIRDESVVKVRQCLLTDFATKCTEGLLVERHLRSEGLGRPDGAAVEFSRGASVRHGHVLTPAGQARPEPVRKSRRVVRTWTGAV